VTDKPLTLPAMTMTRRENRLSKWSKDSMWNFGSEGGDWVFTESPALQTTDANGAPSIVTESSPPDSAIDLGDLLLNELRDILHAEKQLTKALPKMAEAARYDPLAFRSPSRGDRGASSAP
jgi:Domain of unknown function (DUF892)